jgi:hypothetical protein
MGDHGYDFDESLYRRQYYIEYDSHKGGAAVPPRRVKCSTNGDDTMSSKTLTICASWQQTRTM